MVEEKDLVVQSKQILSRAYCPYSKFKVAALLECEDGTVVPGVNVENASYGGTICAERSAVVAAVSQGHRKFKRIVVTTKLEEPASPCGLCRQFLVEFGDFEVVMVGSSGKIERKSTMQLLPLAFTPASLDVYAEQQKTEQ